MTEVTVKSIMHTSFSSDIFLHVKVKVLAVTKVSSKSIMNSSFSGDIFLRVKVNLLQWLDAAGTSIRYSVLVVTCGRG